MVKLLVDGDILIYRIGFALEKTKYLVTRGPNADADHLGSEVENAKAAKLFAGHDGIIWSRKEVEPEDDALLLADTILKDIRGRYPEHMGPEVWLSPSVGNFREAIATRAKYKGNRDGVQQPTHFKAIRQHLIDKWGARVTEGQEADDALGIEMTAHPGSVCVSIDKDLLQIPGMHYDWTKEEEVSISKEQGALNFWCQVLSGDPTDNVPGLKGIGPVKAKEMLKGAKNNREAWRLIMAAYTAALSENQVPAAVETARLVYVRRRPNEMWRPPNTRQVRTKRAATADDLSVIEE